MQYRAASPEKSRLMAWMLGGISLALAIAVAIAAFCASERERYARRLQDMITQSYYELVGRMESVHADMGKLMVASTPESNITLLGDIARQSEEAAACLTQLPAGHPALADTLRFLNQTSDLCRSLMAGAAHGLPLRREELELIGELREVYSAVMDTMAEVDTGSLVWTDAEPGGWYTEGESDSMYRTSVEYPTMIYDGPFSDGLDGREAMGLTGEEIGPSRAAEIAGNFLETPDRSSMEIQRVQTGSISGYVITTESEGLYITQTGGEILWYMDGRTSDASALLDAEACIRAAEEHLQEMGFEGMEAVWHQVYDDMAVINFAPAVDGAVIYPDLIKVRIRRGDGTLAALDATEYWMHHRERDIPHPLVSREEARNVVSDQLRITGSRSCIIPTEGGGERLCWEFRGTFGEDTYLVYIDAMTGAEADIFLVIPTDGGVLVI